jgi:fumarylpyruvate hydrolase
MSEVTFAFPPEHRPSAGIHGSSQQFPIHRIYCVGQNYADHAREMGADPQREPPFFFAKPADALLMADGSAATPAAVAYPARTTDLQHEIELVVALGRGGSNIAAEKAADHVFGFACGVDLTRRDLQKVAKDHGRPWDTSKGFDQSAPVSDIHPVQQMAWPEDAAIWLTVNGELRQQGNIRAMIWNISEIIAELSTLYHLLPGDLIFTGTPAGVGPVQRGDLIQGAVEGIATVAFRIE